MPIPSIDRSYSEMLSSSIALTCLYTWNRYCAFGTDIVRNLTDAFIYAVFRFTSRAHCIASVAREMVLSSSAFVLLDTRKSLKPLRRREILSDLSNAVKKILHKISCHRLFKEKIAVFKCEL